MYNYKYRPMKKFTCLLLVLMSISVASAQDISFTFDNAQITNDGANDFYEVDVMVSSSADLKVGTGQFYINYNTTAFGTFVQSSGAGNFESTAGILNNTYWNLIYTDNSESRVSYAYVQLAPEAAYTAAQTVTTTPKLFTHLKIQYLAGQSGIDPSICFESGPGFTDLNFTACGGVFGADCATFPGVRITDDSFDCSGSVVSLGCASTTIWNGTAWDNGIPDSNTIAIMDGDYNTNTEDTDITACELIINSDVTVAITAGRFAHIENDIAVDGNLLVAHQGSVVQVNDAAIVTNNGFIEVRVSTPNLASRDFMVLGSPMTAESRNDVYASSFLVLDQNTANFVPHPDVTALFPLAENFADDNNDYWSIYGAGPIIPGEGYIVRPQSGYGAPGGVFNFTHNSGTLNNGAVDFEVVFNTEKNDSPNALSNPYPSAISADDFINANTMINEVYFWEHLTPPSPGLPGAGSMNFSMEDISMYNLMGGTAASADPTGVDTEPNGIIATSQGFGIKAEAGGTAQFTNSMRRTTGNTTLRTSGSETGEKDRLWISIASEKYELQNTTLVGFSEATTASVDNGYDSRRLASVLSIFSEIQGSNVELGIQSRESFQSDIKVPLGFSSLVDTPTEYSIAISKFDGINMEQATVYLYDNLLDVTTNLSVDGRYNFTSEKGTFNKRFTLFFELDVLSNQDYDTQKIVLFPNPTKEGITISAINTSIEKIEIFDIQGRLVESSTYNQEQTVKLSLTNIQAGVYFMTASTTDGQLMKRFIKE